MTQTSITSTKEKKIAHMKIKMTSSLHHGGHLQSELKEKRDGVEGFLGQYAVCRETSVKCFSKIIQKLGLLKLLLTEILIEINKIQSNKTGKEIME